MSKPTQLSAPPDQEARQRALDPHRSFIVEAPAGAGKTTILATRFLTLLAEVDEPSHIVAITFTIDAAAEMRNRILDSLRSAEPSELAQRVLARSEARGWKLLDLPAQLRISTIDSFCRELALRQPLLSGLGGALDVAEDPRELYRLAAWRTIRKIRDNDYPEVSAAVETLLDWRDNNRNELETLLIEMLQNRDRWMRDFLLASDPDWDQLRAQLERPFTRAVRKSAAEFCEAFSSVPGACDEAMSLARFACGQLDGEKHAPLAELAEFPTPPFPDSDLDSVRCALQTLAQFLLTKEGEFRKSPDKNHGFPADRRTEKERFKQLVAVLSASPHLKDMLAALLGLPPAHYTDEDWSVIRACFILLRHAAGELKVVFAQQGKTDFTEVAQIALDVLLSEDRSASDAAIAVGDETHHILVDEFQDTNRRQHQLVENLIRAWPERESRTIFCVGDPMQSIYSFREADPELFSRVKHVGFELSQGEALLPEFVRLSANFRTTPSLVESLNGFFESAFSADDGSGIQFSPAIAARPTRDEHTELELHAHFNVKSKSGDQLELSSGVKTQSAMAAQTEAIVGLVSSLSLRMQAAIATGESFRIAILARKRNSLLPIAVALRELAIPFLAVDLEPLATRPEVEDAIALARALSNPYDRLSWIGVLRAPWCALSLADLHRLTSDDSEALLARPVPELMRSRVDQLSETGRAACRRVLDAVEAHHKFKDAFPTATLGSQMQQVWVALGGEDCWDAAAKANIELLWNCLDRLPQGSQDILGPQLDAALEKLTARPDPGLDANVGVQLMTIHKSKGLEFEVVIVPDIQAENRSFNKKMLSWMERGVDASADPEEDDARRPTEFLIAPIKSRDDKVADTLKWVEAQIKNRESQELRRLLYVAATRARDELHLFAAIQCSEKASGEVALPEPRSSLLRVAWPALQSEMERRFEAWNTQRLADLSAEQNALVETLAAAAEVSTADSGSTPSTRPAILRRLPLDYSRSSVAIESTRTRQRLVSSSPRFDESADGDLFSRVAGGLRSRALGTAVHLCLETFARARESSDRESAIETLRERKSAIAAKVRASGIDQREAEGIAEEAVKIATQAVHDETGAWILSPHRDAQNEVRWSGVVAGKIRTVQSDRVFRTGSEPFIAGDDVWWIIDYKTHEDNSSGATGDTLQRLRPKYSPQLELYAQVLRNLHGTGINIRCGLYYARMRMLDWWAVD